LFRAESAKVAEGFSISQTVKTDYFLPQKTRTVTEKSRREITKKDQKEFFFVFEFFRVFPWIPWLKNIFSDENSLSSTERPTPLNLMDIMDPM